MCLLWVTPNENNLDPFKNLSPSFTVNAYGKMYANGTNPAQKFMLWKSSIFEKRCCYNLVNTVFSKGHMQNLI